MAATKAAKKAVKEPANILDIVRDEANEITLAVTEGLEDVVQASPKAAYHALDALRGDKQTVLEVTSRGDLAPILLIEAPDADSDLAKAAQDFGTMKHVSIVAGGESAEVIWHA